MVMVRLRLACLAFALLWAQWLGLNHAIWHSPIGLASSAQTEASQSASKPHAHAGDSHAVLEAPEWLSHHSDTECRLFDQRPATKQVNRKLGQNYAMCTLEKET